MANPKRLYLSTTDKKLAGVCGGIGDYYSVDSTLIRLVWALATVFSGGLGVFAYIAAMIIIPSSPEEQ